MLKNLETLKELCETPGIPGYEDAVRAVMRKHLNPILGPENIQTDAIGNLIAHKEGSKPRIMIAGHLDQIGFIVKSIDSDGFLRLQPLGGFDPVTLMPQRVRVHSASGDLPGVIGSPAIHTMTDEQKKKRPQLENIAVDLGLRSVEKVRELVDIGTPVTLESPLIELGESIAALCLDNRVSLWCIIEALKSTSKVDSELFAVSTVQEEVGVRGAQIAAGRINPQIGIAIDTTIAADIPGSKPENHVTQLGKGVAIKVADSRSISHRGLLEHCKKLAKSRDIPFQLEVLPRGGTDAGGIFLGADSAAVITLSVPCRYVHTTCETIDPRDLQATCDLLVALLETAQEVPLVPHP